MPVDALAHVIQLSVAPVFLLTGLGAMLSVLANRIGRIVDRARVVARHLETAGEGDCTDLHRESASLSVRARITQIAISLLVLSALLVSLVIVALFAGALFSLNTAVAVAVLFGAAMLALIGGLIFFLREVHMAIGSLVLGPR